jgi:hypothetical protein
VDFGARPAATIASLMVLSICACSAAASTFALARALVAGKRDRSLVNRDKKALPTYRCCTATMQPCGMQCEAGMKAGHASRRDVVPERRPAKQASPFLCSSDDVMRGRNTGLAVDDPLLESMSADVTSAPSRLIPKQSSITPNVNVRSWPRQGKSRSERSSQWFACHRPRYRHL